MGYELHLLVEQRHADRWVKVEGDWELARRQLLICVLTGSRRSDDPDEQGFGPCPTLPSFRGLPSDSHLHEEMEAELVDRAVLAVAGRDDLLTGMERSRAWDFWLGTWTDYYRCVTHYTLAEIEAHPWDDPVDLVHMMSGPSFELYERGEEAFAGYGAKAYARGLGQPARPLLEEAEYRRRRDANALDRDPFDVDVVVRRTLALRDAMPPDFWELVDRLRALARAPEDVRVICGFS